MNSRIYILILFLALSVPGLAQQRPAIKKQIENARIAWITRSVDLSTEEAQQFWPIYNSYQKELETARMQRQRKLNASTDASQSLNDEEEFDTRILNLKKRYRRELDKVLPPIKIRQLFTAEREFQGQLLKQLKKRRP